MNRRAEIDRTRSIVTVARVLIVEDEADLGLLLAYSLEAEGFSAEVCERGDEAELWLAERPSDLVILDWIVRGVSGR
jgi:two-component system phosphate regulon response regulator PhoB